MSTFDETPERWGRRINTAREQDGLSRLTAEELAAFECERLAAAHGRDVAF